MHCKKFLSNRDMQMLSFVSFFGTVIIHLHREHQEKQQITRTRGFWVREIFCLIISERTNFRHKDKKDKRICFSNVSTSLKKKLNALSFNGIRIKLQ